MMISAYLLGWLLAFIGVFTQAADLRQNYPTYTDAVFGEQPADPSFLSRSPYSTLYYANDNPQAQAPAQLLGAEAAIPGQKRAYMRLGKRAYMRLGKRADQLQEMMEKRARLRLG
ncbi:unnamed protein product [Bursaphelenchus xylophilus]|uniref:(pine wood nematode) hypothetical protein n=1 Tax=Bursaphelenchus xylophilus TaxID=6326 RepID=A0A1I7SBS0_BURXY|nr:unnamed protein product [Bursaphelenchus xylophilus]CAG9111180.1 unnamed protein product [Bursaphelenchus xylophilus]